MKRLVGGVGHLCEGAQETVGARQLEQRFLAVLRCRRGDQHDIVEGLKHQLLQRLARPRHIFDDAAAIAVRQFVEDRHAVGGAGCRGLDEGAGEGPQKRLVEAKDRDRAVVIDRGAHLQRRPQRGAALKVIGRSKIKIDRVNRHRRRQRTRR